jgi:poly(3-hydroxybutyrate) depolymerase
MTAQHAWITSMYGNNCTDLAEPFINNCGLDFGGNFLRAVAAADGLQWNNTRGVYNPGAMFNFSQAAFGASPSNNSMDPLGWIYAPRACMAGTRACRLHINFHGCEQGRAELGDTYVRQTQLNEWAESNGIVILYPQVGAA